MRKTYGGSCHCGALQFEATFDLGEGTIKCNCSICRKMRLWSVRVDPADFRLLAGEMEIIDYRGNNAVAHHLFCSRCGMHPFEWVDVPNMSGSKYYNVNVACIDGIDIDELMRSPVRHLDGLHDKWGEPPDEIRHL